MEFEEAGSESSSMSARSGGIGQCVLQPEVGVDVHSLAALSLDGFGDVLGFVPHDSVAYHLRRGDFAAWIRDVLLDEELATRASACSDRAGLSAAVDRRRKELWALLK